MKDTFTEQLPRAQCAHYRYLRTFAHIAVALDKVAVGLVQESPLVCGGGCSAADAARTSGPAPAATVDDNRHPRGSCCTPLPVRCCCLCTSLLPLLAVEPMLAGADAPWLLLDVSELVDAVWLVPELSSSCLV